MASVLLVDDLAFIKLVQKEVIEANGHQIIGDAKDGLEAIEQFKRLHPDIIIMDITMPKMDGITALEHIMNFDKNAKVIMISALGKQDLVKKSLLLGAKNYIVKPLDRKKVLERINQVLTKS